MVKNNIKNKRRRISKRQKICPSGKIAFSDKLSAMLHLAELKHNDFPTVPVKRIYQCNICNNWHLTSKDR